MICPLCRVENKLGPACRRCKCDLTLLFALEEHRASLLQGARRELAEGHWQQAAEEAGKSEWARLGPDASQVLALARLLQGDYEAAWSYYRLAVRANRA